MIRVGLTGSIAMGKSTTARMFAAHGVPVFDSDAAVHDLYSANGAAVGSLGRLVPHVIRSGVVSRPLLASHLAQNPDCLSDIESIVHPLVRGLEREFLVATESTGAPFAILDIPLLFEKGRENDVDTIVLVSCTPELQRQRALNRPGMSPEKLAFLLARQTPDAAKRQMAQHVIDTSGKLESTEEQVRALIARLQSSSMETSHA